MLVLLLAACGAAPESEPRAELSVRNAWARPADSGATTAVYFVVHNASAIPDTMRGVASGDAEAAEMHVSTQQGGMMHMSPITSLQVPANDSVSFRPLGAHVMLMRVRRGLAAGDTVAITLSFESGQSLDVRAGVRRP